MNFCTVDIPNKTLTLLTETDGRELVAELSSLFDIHLNQQFPIDSWIPGDSEDTNIYMCETEQWRVVNTQLITNTTWIDWKHG